MATTRQAGGPHAGRAETFPREGRLRRRVDYLAVQQAAQQPDGRRVSGRNFLLLARRRAGAKPQPARLGITVSRKVGNAVARNRVKRWVRESYRRLPGPQPAGQDLVLIARPGAADRDFRTTSAEIASLLRRLRT